MSVYYYFTPDYNSNYILSTLSSENFNVERFKFTKEPGGTVVDGEFTENANVVPCGGSLRLSWDTTGKNIRYEVIYAPTDGSAEPVTVELNNRKYYDFESPNEYKDYTCFVRAWLDDDVQLISRMFTIHCEGISADIELNGGSYGAAVSADGEWIREKQQKLNANSDGIAALPECTIVPPEGMMFDKWCVTDHKAFLMAQDSASEQPFITENLLVNGEYGFPTYDFYYPGANISVQSGYTYIFPIWKPRVYEWVGGDISKVFDEEPLTFCLNDSVSPFIPSEFFDFCYEEDSFEPKEPDWQIMYSASVDGETEFYYMEIEPVLDENAAGGVRFRAWGPSDIGSYALILMYKGETKHVIPFRITDEHEGQLEVDEYKANGTYPTQDGAIFAGWFADSEYTTAYTEDTGYAYAKFIAEECLTIRWQVPTDFADQDTTDIRLITSLDCGKYDSLHIVLKYTDTDALISDGKCTRLLDTVNGYVDSSNVEYRPEDVFCEDSHYFGAYKVTGMPKEKYDSSLTAYAYIVTQDGTVVNGSALTFIYMTLPQSLYPTPIFRKIHLSSLLITYFAFLSQQLSKCAIIYFSLRPFV